MSDFTKFFQEVYGQELENATSGRTLGKKYNADLAGVFCTLLSAFRELEEVKKGRHMDTLEDAYSIQFELYLAVLGVSLYE